jgi:hypothetical protein
MNAVTRKDIRTYAGELVALLGSEGIDSAESLKRFEGKAHRIGTAGAYVGVSDRPSNFGAVALTLSYILHGTGIPIEAKINRQFEYSKLVIKLDEDVEGYSFFMVDPQGNLMQERTFAPGGFEDIINELKRLAQ